MQNKETNEFDTFFLSFCGQHIILTTSQTQTYTVDNQITEILPLAYEGILLDYDEEFYFLGRTPNEISHAVKRDKVIHIGIAEVKDQFGEILDNMPEPKKEEDVN